MNKNLRNLLIGKPFRIVTGLVVGLTVAYFLLGYFAVDPVARRLLPWVGEHRLASGLTAERVQFDPLRLTVTVDKLRLNRPDGSALAGFERLYVDLEANGVLDLAWHLRDIRLTAPYARFDIAPDGRFNWADVIAKLNEDKEPDDGTIPRVIIDHILIERGKLQYTERNRPTPFETELAPLALELDSFSTLPQDRGDYLLSAKMPEQGATLRWKGELGVNPLYSTGLVDIQGLRLAELMKAIRSDAIPLRLTEGELAVSFSYGFAMVEGPSEPEPQARLGNIALRLAELTGQLSPHTVLTLAEAEATLPGLDLALHQGSYLQVQGLEVGISQLALTTESKHLLKINRADVKGIDYDLAQNRLDIAGILLSQGEINAMRDKNGHLDWQQALPAAEAGEAPAEVPANGTPPFNFAIAGLELREWKAAFEDRTFVHPLRAEVQNVSLGLDIRNSEGALAVNLRDSALAGLTLRSARYPQPVASLARIGVEGGTIDVRESNVTLPAIRLSGLETLVTLDAKQTVNWLAVLETPPAAAASTMPESAPPSPWKVSLGTLALEKASVHVEDRSGTAPVAFDVQNGMIEIRQGSLDFSRAVPLKASLQLKQGGRLEAAGRMALAPLKGDFQVKLDGVPLQPFSPYLARHALLKLTDGQAALRGKLSLRSGKALGGQFAGGFRVDNLAITEEVDGRPFLSWKSVASDSLKLSIAPDRLHLDELRIREPVGRVIIYEDRSLNVQRLMRPQTAAVPTTPAPNPGQAEPFPVLVERVSVEGGDLEFADLSLVPQFGTRIHDLTGVVNGLTSDAAGTAQVELDGKVDDYGSARIRGAIQPFRATDFTDLTLTFRNLEMNRLTPYSGKFAGRKIDSGQMSVDLEYKVKNRQLTGQNKFVINTLKLGERVESPDAVDLPLDLAIALLEDSNGVIDLDLPISGNLDDPQFSYGKIVWKAIVNVIGKAVTAPFRALGKLLGISPDKLEAIAFDPGTSALAPPEQEKLKVLADAMAKRPALALRVTPAYDAAADKAALQEQAIRRIVLKEMGLPLREDEQPGPVDLNNVKVQTAVENLHKDLKGEPRSLKAVDAVRDYFRNPKPEELPRYEAMLRELKAAVKVPDTELEALANARAGAVRSYLVEKAALPPERVTLGTPNKVAGSGSVPLKMELGVAERGS